MKWKKFKIKTTTEAEDIVISTLYDIGLEGAQIEDKVPLTAMEKEQMFVDILPEGPADDGHPGIDGRAHYGKTGGHAGARGRCARHFQHCAGRLADVRRMRDVQRYQGKDRRSRRTDDADEAGQQDHRPERHGTGADEVPDLLLSLSGHLQRAGVDRGARDLHAAAV